MFSDYFFNLYASRKVPSNLPFRCLDFTYWNQKFPNSVFLHFNHDLWCSLGDFTLDDDWMKSTITTNLYQITTINLRVLPLYSCAFQGKLFWNKSLFTSILHIPLLVFWWKTLLCFLVVVTFQSVHFFAP